MDTDTELFFTVFAIIVVCMVALIRILTGPESNRPSDHDNIGISLIFRKRKYCEIDQRLAHVLPQYVFVARSR